MKKVIALFMLIMCMFGCMAIYASNAVPASNTFN